MMHSKQEIFINGNPLVPGQLRAFNDICAFLVDPDAKAMILEGHAGTGKSTLLRAILNELPDMLDILNLVLGTKNVPPRPMIFTSTTGKAAEVLENITRQKCKTIHSLLGILVNTDYKTGKTTLKLRQDWNNEDIINSIIWLDEASNLNQDAMDKVRIRLKGTGAKVIFIGDRYQLIDFDATCAPVFELPLPISRLTEIVRSGSKYIVAACEVFRNAVITGDYAQIEFDGKEVLHLNRKNFNAMIEADFTAKNWVHTDSKYVTFKNKVAIAYNNWITDLVTGTSEFQKGDHAICNGFVKTTNSQGGVSASISNNAMIFINEIIPTSKIIAGHTFAGKEITIQETKWFMPLDIRDKKTAIHLAKGTGNYKLVRSITDGWIDLRAIYASTVHKSQGSTYKRTYIDLDDISSCWNKNIMARLLYVAASRSSEQVIFTGEL